MPAASCSEVEQAWLDAGRRGDVKVMQGLRKEHPEWLALDRVVAAESSPKNLDDGDEAPSFCDWEKFHLPTVGASALHAAAWDGEYEVLEFLLKEGQQVDERGRRGVTALMATLMRHNVQALRAVFQGTAVVQLNTVVDCRKEDEERLKHTLSVVKLLLRHGAKTEARDNDGKTALFLATNDELFEVAKLLLENGAHLDAQDSIGRSPLHACLRASPEQSVLVTNLLVSCGAPIDLPDNAGETPFTIVVRHGDITALQLLLNHHSLVATPARQDFSGAVLLQAAELGVVDVVRFLLDGKYSSIDVVNARGETTLHLAIAKQRKALIEMLCKSKSAELLLTARTQGKGESVLHYAVRYGTPSDLQLVLSLLGKRGSTEVNVASAQGLTPLYLATTASTAGSPSERRAKVAQLENLGASLFSSDALLFREVKNLAGVTLVAMNPAVRRCLMLWMAECSASSPTAFSDFCVNWVACVQRPQTNSSSKQQPAQVTKEKQAPTQHRVPLTPALAALVCAGYATDSVPLLLSLPLKRERVPRFLEVLKTLGADTKHALLQKLQVELHAGWEIEVASAPKDGAPTKAKK
ncbi:DNA polymerase [Phytophthora cinnamomi]|uniref:DNA polymerase n=1 Tax=Phytophthora cinnamomi TaxID=4785 RepID=UPI003559D964|nr:DNA polymerase [Phytophthora cinnamomi]